MNPSELFSPFLPTTSNIPEDQDRVKSYLGEKFSYYADVINDKKIGVITQANENFNGEKWFYLTPLKTRNGYQTIAYIASLPNTTSLTLTLTSDPAFPIQDIDENFVITLVYGSASRPSSNVLGGDYFSFMSQGDSRISFTMSDTSIIITTTTDLSAYSGFIVISYLRDGV